MADFFLGYDSSGRELWAASPGGYAYVDLRGKLPGSPQPSQGVVFKDGGVIVHYNGPAVIHGDVDQLYIDANYHRQKNWGTASNPAYTNGIQYEWGIGADGTKYRLRNPGASLWHCGNTYYNPRAFAATFIFGDGQYPTAKAKASMAELCDELLDIQGLGRAGCKGHREVGSSRCPGSGFTHFVLPYRNGDLAAPAPPEEPPATKTNPNIWWINYVYSPGDGWGQKIAGAMAEGGFAAGLRGGLTKRAAKAAADAREQRGVYTFLVGDKAVARARQFQAEFTDLDIVYNHGGSVRVVEAAYRKKAKWRIADFCEEKELDKAAAIGAFEEDMD